MASGPNLLMNMFGRPRGIIGRLGGVIMARMNAVCGVWVAGLLEVTPDDAVLEIGFGPGVIIQCLSKLASAGHVAGIDPSPEMVEQARARNAIAIKDGRVDLLRGSARACRSPTTPLIRRWRSTPCRSGRTPRPDCAQSSAL
jgi:SAM-dependent methyltransferase